TTLPSIPTRRASDLGLSTWTVRPVAHDPATPRGAPKHDVLTQAPHEGNRAQGRLPGGGADSADRRPGESAQAQRAHARQQGVARSEEHTSELQSREN